MSFGTGHHESTYLMMEEMLGLNFNKKTVCDAGCGTGILSVLAVKKGAQHVLAIDIEEWAYRNALDNIALNGIYDQIDVELGDFSLMEGKQFDIILANIKVIKKITPYYFCRISNAINIKMVKFKFVFR